jgi:hypothetical protein
MKHGEELHKGVCGGMRVCASVCHVYVLYCFAFSGLWEALPGGCVLAPRYICCFCTMTWLAKCNLMMNVLHFTVLYCTVLSHVQASQR